MTGYLAAFLASFMFITATSDLSCSDLFAPGSGSDIQETESVGRDDQECADGSEPYDSDGDGIVDCEAVGE